MKKVCIVGGGIAGLTSAYWLDYFGFDVTIIEKAPKLRDEGYVIDFAAEGVQIAGAMGILPELKKLKESYQTLSFVDKNKQRIGGFNVADIQQFVRSHGSEYIPLMRGDLERTLFAALPKNTDMRFNETITSLEQSSDCVSVEFSSGKKETFDMVIGADGIHSQTRAMVFGPEEDYLKSLGCFIFITRIEGAGSSLEHQAMGNIEKDHFALAVPVAGGDMIAVMGCNSSENLQAVRKQGARYLRNLYSKDNLFPQEIVSKITDEHFIFTDEVAQIRMDSWTNNRVALIGDAASCPTLLTGQGAIMAMSQAYILAHELYQSGGDHTKAFSEYEKIMQPVLAQKMKNAGSLSKTFLPSSIIGVKMINFLFGLTRHKWIHKLMFRQFLPKTIFTKGYPLVKAGTEKHS